MPTETLFEQEINHFQDNNDYTIDETQEWTEFLTDAVSRLTLSNGVDLTFLWTWNTDIESDTSGLITREGVEKQAYELWDTYYHWGED